MTCSIPSISSMKNTGLANNGLFSGNIDKLEQPDKYTVVFHLKTPNSRFHAAFTVRWGAIFMMPKHIFEKEKDPVAFKFNPPVSLGAYTLKDFDPNGKWYLWQRRDDWKKTSVALLGDVAVKYAMYIDPGPSDKRVIAQTAHELDVIHDCTPEGRITLAKNSPTSVGWFQSFPWAHPDPTLPAVIYNNEKPGLDKKEVRWALTLAIDIAQVALASYKGAATISAIHVPPTGMYPHYYHEPLEPWLNDFTIKVGGQDYKPYDPTAAQRIADLARQSLGDLVPTDPDTIKKYIGAGWWKYDLKAAEQLMLDAGMKKAGGKWALPDGSPFKVPLMSMGETNPTMNRAAAAVVENWKAFGIDATLDAQANLWPIVSSGEYTASLCLDDRDLGWASRPVLLPPVLALKVLRSERQKRCGHQQHALEEPRTRQDHRKHPEDLLRRSQGRRAGTAVLQARRTGYADHPASWRTTSSRPWTPPTSQGIHLWMIPIRIRCRTGLTPSICTSRLSPRTHDLAAARSRL